MVLGDHFPKKFQNQHIQNNYNVGTVLYLFCDFTTPNPKDKFLVLVCKKPKPLFFVINSLLNPYIKKRKKLLACQVSIDAASHKFLDHDSYIDCMEAHPLSLENIDSQIMSDLSRIKDKVSDGTKKELIEAVDTCVVLPHREKGWILDSLKQ